MRYFLNYSAATAGRIRCPRRLVLIEIITLTECGKTLQGYLSAVLLAEPLNLFLHALDEPVRGDNPYTPAQPHDPTDELGADTDDDRRLEMGITDRLESDVLAEPIDDDGWRPVP